LNDFKTRLGLFKFKLSDTDFYRPADNLNGQIKLKQWLQTLFSGGQKVK